MQSFHFEKCHSLGNDFVVVMAESEHALAPGQLRMLADRHRGVGFDQLMWLWPDCERDQVDCRARIFNSDGSESEQCMNGLRSVGYLLQSLVDPDRMTWCVEVAGRQFSLMKTGEFEYGLECDLALFDLPNKVSLELNQEKVDLDVVDVGNPHAVLRSDRGLAAGMVSNEQASLAQKVAGDASFPMGVNVGVCSVTASNQLALHVLERGAGWTQACGSGALAAAWVARHQGWLQSNEVEVCQPGGKVKVTWRDAGLTVRISGHVAWVFRGEWRGEGGVG